ncbi:MAG: hypothetical protein ACRDQU_04550 [Pseudonocardiaceae bacterium]
MPTEASAPTNALPVSELAPNAVPTPNRIVAAAPVDAPAVTPSRTRGTRTCSTIASCAAGQVTACGQPSR